MLPSVRIPPLVPSAETSDILNPSTMIYLRQVTLTNPFALLPYPLPALRFVEAMRPMDLRGARILHATDASRDAMHLLRRNEADVLDDATVIFSDLPLVKTVQLSRKQRVGGTLVCVVGDLVARAHVQLIYLLCAAYKSVRVQALAVSHADPERLLICTNFVERTDVGEPPFCFEMSRYFLTKLEEINSMNGQVRLETARGFSRDKTTAWMASHLNLS